MLKHMEMTIAEGARALNIAPDTLRRRIRRGQVAARQVRRPQGYVWMVDLVDTSTPIPETQTHHNNDDLVDLLREQLREKDRQIDHLHQLLATRVLQPVPERHWWRFWR